MSDSLRPRELQHARPPCPSSTPGVHLNSCPLSRWCHPAISSCVVPLSSCLQSFPASGSFPVSRLFPSGGQSIGASASASFLPVSAQDWSPLGWTGWTYIHSRVCQSQSPNFPPTFPSVVSACLFSTSVSISVCKQVSLYCFLNSTCMRYYVKFDFLFLTDFSVWQSLGRSGPLQMAWFRSLYGWVIFPYEYVPHLLYLCLC